MSEADDIKEFMGLVGKGHERATQKDIAEVKRQLAEVTQDPNLTIGGPSNAEIASYIEYCNEWFSRHGLRTTVHGRYVKFDPATGLYRRC